MSIVNLMLAGLLFGLPYILTGRLGLSIGLHITWNVFQGHVFGFPVSGGGSQMTMIATSEQGPDL
jgi:membrane protease YdiL (CAAX protease family)